MSHNYLFRPPAGDSDRRPDRVPHASPDRRHPSPDRRQGSLGRRNASSGHRRGSPDRQPASPDRRYSSSDRRRAASDRDFHRPPLESLSVSHPPTSFSSRGAPLPQDGALGILNSCGLEPADLALLAELPEDVLTVESLPQVLQQIKGKRGTVKPHLSGSRRPPSYSSSSSYTPSSSRQSSLNLTAGEWDHPRSWPAQFPPEEVTHGPLSPELDRWGNPSPGSSVRTQPPSLLSLVVDYNYKPGSSDNGKTARNASPVFSQDYNHRTQPSVYGKTGRDASPVSSQDYVQRPQPSVYGKTGRDASPVSSQDYVQRPQPSVYGKTGRDASPVSSQDYMQRPQLSVFGKTGRDSRPVSIQDYNQRPGSSDYSKTSRDAGPVSSRDYNHRPGLSDYGKTGRDSGLVSLLDYGQRLGLSDYDITGRDAGPVTSLDYNHEPGLSDYGKRCRDADPVSSLDYNKTPGLSGYGKTGRDTAPALSRDQPPYSSAGGTKRTQCSRFSQLEAVDHMAVPPPEEHYPTTLGQRGEPEISSIRSSSCSRLAIGAATAGLMPSKKEALDFHGTSPPGFPYSCSLCDITVMSEKVWIKHINGPHHADGQLNLLQKFPNWDCRMETISRPDDQSEKKKDEGKAPQQPQTAPPSASILPSNKKKASGKGRVVCVRFPAQSVDEAYLRKLAEPFGKIVTVLMFPSLAFVELGTIDQAKDLVKFYAGSPPVVNGENLEFRISTTFNFLQSSRVVSFFPAPVGEESLSDLMTIIKNFGSPLYTLFLPSKAFVEMKNTPDAQKMVDFYSSKALMVNNESIKVSFSVEYKSLMRVPAAKRYDEETSSSKRTQSSSRENEEKKTETKRRRRRRSSEDREKERKEGEKSSRGERTRSRSRRTSGDKSIQEKSRSSDKSRKDGRSRSRERTREKSSKEVESRSKDKSSSGETTGTRSKSREKSTKEKSPRTKSGSGDKSMEKSSGEGRSRSRDKSSKDTRTKSNARERSTGETRSREESSSKSSGQSRSTRELVVPEKTTDCESRTDPDPDPVPVKDSKPEAEDKDSTEEEDGSSAEESDIEGVEVIGEDGESLDDGDGDEEEDHCPAERTDLPKEDNEKEETAVQEKVIEIKKEAADDREEMIAVKMEVDDQQRGMQIKKEAEDERKPSKIEEGEKKQQEEAVESEAEDSDFPINLEDCITLDELGEDQSDEQDEKVPDESNTSSSRVVYFNNLCSLDDADFVELVKDFGTAVKFYRVRGRREGFIEMSTSSEALRVVEEMRSNSFTVYGFRVNAHISNRYIRLTNGLSPQWKGDVEKDSSSRRCSERLNIDRSKERKSEGREESLKKTPEKDASKNKDSASKNTQEKKLSIKTSEKESSSQKKDVSKKSQAEELTPEISPGEESTREISPGEESTPEISPGEESTREISPGEEPTREISPGEESTREISPGEESTREISPGEESTREISPGEEPTREISPGEEPTREISPGEESTREISPGEESTREISPGEESTREISPGEEPTCKNIAEKASVNENTERYLKLTEEKISNEESTAKTLQAKEPPSRTSPENKTLKRKGSCENGPVPEKKEKNNESANDDKKRSSIHKNELSTERTAATAKSSEGQGEQSGVGMKRSPDRPEPQTDQGAAVDGLQDSEAALQEQQQSVGGAVERQDPTRPVGTEFVRPVVGYFCNLCQLIYADEDEAKLQHCSTLMHYRKYQEKTGKDPWAS